MKSGRIEIPFGAQNLVIETGKFAKQAGGSITVTVGGTSVLVCVCMSRKPRENIDFFPLMVEYQEKTYAAGRIPGGFFKREGRPSQKEILTCRMIDRPIRPLFPQGFYNDVVVTCTVLSSDGVNDPDIMAIVGASAALTVSDIPFNGPIGAVRVGMIEGEYILNPTYEQMAETELNLVVVGLEGGIVMLEGEANEIPEDKVNGAMQFAFDELQAVRKGQIELCKQVGKEKSEVALFNPHPDLKAKVRELTKDKLAKSYRIDDKTERETALHQVKEDLLADLTAFDSCKVDDQDVPKGHILMMLDQIEYEEVRRSIFEDGVRADGRGLKDIRDLTSEIDVLQRTHGSALFTRGQTQSLSIVTLGTKRDEQLIESLTGVTYNNFMLHYNFPAFSVGEARGSRGPGRREIGHGALAAKSIKAVLPKKEDFPYTIRLVSEILESNGSSSMASVCAGTLSLMAAGVPIKEAVAGISIGVVTDGDDYRLLTDIMGLEDHFGDMDFKISGTKNGITAIQLDLKITGAPIKLLFDGVAQAKEAREQILDSMAAVIAKPKSDTSEFAPRITKVKINPEKIGEVIGPGGKMIKRIIEDTGCEAIDIDDDGTVLIAGLNKESVEKAKQFISGLTELPEVGKIYDAKVVKVMNFGAFCEFQPGKQGLVHVSELSKDYVKDISDVVKIGDEFKVKLVEIDKMNRMNLSKRQAEENAE